MMLDTDTCLGDAPEATFVGLDGKKSRKSISKYVPNGIVIKMLATSSKRLAKTVHNNLGQQGYLFSSRKNSAHCQNTHWKHPSQRGAVNMFAARHIDERNNNDDEPYDDPFIKELFKLPYEERIVKGIF